MIENPRSGMRVRILKLDRTDAMIVHKKHLRARKKGVTGTVYMCVPAHGGDVWFVEHDGGQSVFAAYSTNELELIEEAS